MSTGLSVVLKPQVYAFFAKDEIVLIQTLDSLLQHVMVMTNQVYQGGD